MGQPKALLKIENSTFIKRIYLTLIESGVENVVIVAGKHYDEISKCEPELASMLTLNPDPTRGQLSSFRIGLEKLMASNNAVIMALVDHPLVRTSTVKNLIEEYKSSENQIIIPSKNGKKGHPVLFGEAVFEQLLSTPLEQGAKPVVRNNQEITSIVEVEDSGILKDIDTRDEYMQVIKDENK